jgi:2-polyprenyl-3-methyl-5-hydroxy-6-metoxy-1,4-benzoquinol methylase
LKADVLSGVLKPMQFDVVISSLFTHHFDDRQWVQLIRKMVDCATYAVIVNDLHRHWFAYHAIGILTRVFSKSHLVKHDSKVSVLKGFKKKELITILEEAGISNYTIKWKWAFRWQIIIRK